MKEIWIQYKIPENWDWKQALEFKNKWWDKIEALGISCDTGVGLGQIDIHAMCKNQSQQKALKAMLGSTGWKIV